MKGYVKNKTSLWRHAMKRNIGPGQQVPLIELYKQYGEKYEIPEGSPFVEWLINVKLKDRSIWDVVYEEPVSGDVVVKEEEPTEEIVYPKEKVVNKERFKEAAIVPLVKKDVDLKDVINMPVRQARADLKKITDLNLLKHALQEVRQLAHKDTLALMIRKRVQELELTRR